MSAYRGLFHGAFDDNKDTPVVIPIPDAQTQARFDEQRDFSKWLDGCLNGIAEQREAGELETAIDKLMADELGAIVARTNSETRQHYLDELRNYIAFAKRAGVSTSLPMSAQNAAIWIVTQCLSERNLARVRQRIEAARFLNEHEIYFAAALEVCRAFCRGDGGGGVPVATPRANDNNSGPVALAAGPANG